MASLPHITNVVESSEKSVGVAIVGGGIGGLCLALGLLEQSHLDVQVYEAAHTFSKIGAGISLGLNAVRALDIMGPAAKQAMEKQTTGSLRSSHLNAFQYKVLSPELIPKSPSSILRFGTEGQRRKRRHTHLRTKGFRGRADRTPCPLSRRIGQRGPSSACPFQEKAPRPRREWRWRDSTIQRWYHSYCRCSHRSRWSAQHGTRIPGRSRGCETSVLRCSHLQRVDVNRYGD